MQLRALWFTKSWAWIPAAHQNSELRFPLLTLAECLLTRLVAEIELGRVELYVRKMPCTTIHSSSKFAEWLA